LVDGILTERDGTNEEPARGNHGVRRRQAGGHANSGRDLLHLGDRAAVSRALTRLARSERLLRISRRYMRPIQTAMAYGRGSGT